MAIAYYVYVPFMVWQTNDLHSLLVQIDDGMVVRQMRPIKFEVAEVRGSCPNIDFVAGPDVEWPLPEHVLGAGIFAELDGAEEFLKRLGKVRLGEVKNY